ncbi:MAG: hypothetical protein GY754_11550 [bacterium]|nr:hypothetical protein [bacterium]
MVKTGYGISSMKMTKINCTSCGAPIEEKNIVEDLAMARCTHCGGVFALEDWPPNKNNDNSTPEERLPIPLPEKIQLTRQGGSLEISYKWFSFVYLFLLFFCIGWNTFMVVWHAISLSSGAWFMSLFGIAHTAVGIGLAYYTLAGFFNRTIITAGMGHLEVRHGPIPWKGNRKLNTMEIEQLYCKEKISNGKNGTSYSYELHVILTGNKPKLKLLKRLQEAEQALFIEQELEKFLGIKDKPVRGEIPR